MKRQFRLLAGAAVLIAALGAGGASLAQDLPMQPPAAKHAAMMHEHMQAHFRALHDILNIRPDQEAAWQALQASMVPPHEAMEHHGDMHADEAMTTPERLDRMSAKMAEHQAAFQRHAEAVKHFYAVLSPEQKRAFDALTRVMMHGMMGGHMGEGGSMGHPGMGMGHEGHDGPPPRP